MGNRLSLQDRILAGVAAMFVLMAVMFAVDTTSANHQATLSDRIITRLGPVRGALRSARQWIVRADDDGAWYILAAGSISSKQFWRAYKADLDRLDSEVREVRRLSDLPQRDAFLAQFDRRWASYLQNNEEAFLLAAGGHVGRARVRYVSVPYQPALDVLLRYEAAVQDEMDGTRAQYAAAVANARIFGFVLNISALALGALIVLRLGGSLRARLESVTRAISEVVHDDLMQLAASFRNIAKRDLNAPAYVCTRSAISETGGRELAALAASYNRLIGGLAEMSERIADAAADARRVKQSEERLSYLLYYDSTTGLPNRDLLRKRIDARIALRAEDAGAFAVAYIKLNDFKRVVDTFGHSSAAELLRMAAVRLTHNVRERDAVARDGADEFILLLDSVDDSEHAKARVSYMMEWLSRPFIIDESELYITSSAGVSVFPGGGINADELLRNADTAMEVGRRTAYGKPTVYNHLMRKRSLERLRIEAHLHRAMATREFELYYQPVVGLQHRRITGLECLLRWRHPKLGILGPSEFLDVAEQTGAIEPLGAWVLEAACMQMQAWRQSGHDLRLCVNVSMRQLNDGRLLDKVRNALQVSGLAPSALELEFTETLILKEGETAASTLSALKDLGVRFAIDDFGTGYSWFGYLRYFVPDTLKIDRSFIVNVARNRVDEAIANSMVMIGHDLGLNVVAEGVEETDQMLTLLKLQCDEMQGFLFAKPAPAEQCEQLLHDTVMLSKAFG